MNSIYVWLKNTHYMTCVLFCLCEICALGIFNMRFINLKYMACIFFASESSWRVGGGVPSHDCSSQFRLWAAAWSNHALASVLVRAHTQFMKGLLLRSSARGRRVGRNFFGSLKPPTRLPRVHCDHQTPSSAEHLRLLKSFSWDERRLTHKSKPLKQALVSFWCLGFSSTLATFE